MHALRWSALIALLAARPDVLSGQVIAGRLLDEETQNPIVGGWVVIAAPETKIVPAQAVTDSAGRFHITLPNAASYRIEASRLGYTTTIIEAFPVRDDETVQVQLRLRVDALPLTPLTVAARSSSRSAILEDRGFYARQKAGSGSFMTREQILARQAYFVSDLFRNIRGFKVRPNRRGTGWLVTNARDSRCLPDIYLNGVKTSRFLTPDDDPINVLRPDHLEGIEAFQGAASIPHQYNPRGTACSVILLWTGER